MKNYETILILNPNLTEDEAKSTQKKIEELISSNGAITSTEFWGKRKLAYPIQKNNEGIYILYKFQSSPDFIDELNRVYNTTDEIIKHIIVRMGN